MPCSVLFFLFCSVFLFFLFFFSFSSDKCSLFQVPFIFQTLSLFVIVARDNLMFLQNWFLEVPRYRNRSPFITGESYAGHYIPQLAELMLQFSKRDKLFHLKGIALGNPVLEFATDFNLRAEFFWSHGLISDSTYKMVMSQVSTETSRFVDKYDVTLDVCILSVFSQSKVLTHQQVGETIDICLEDETVTYLNRQDVQKALHARLVGVRRWAVCSNVLDYELLDLGIPTITIVGRLVKAGIPVMLIIVLITDIFKYTGDQDSVIPLTGSRTLVNRLAKELGLTTTVPYRVWFEGQQVGGWTQVYGNILSFATIRGASHEAPFSQPERSLVLFEVFLEGRPLPEAF
ncbi:hypothetical protein REPUB_Repub01dG0117500 [Reevesia pubescens]